ncbi:MAG: winged helix-turn-helix domain-containing protein [Pseudomonadota bacterium]
MSTHIYKFDAFELDLGSFALRMGEEEIALEPQVMSLLAYLVQNSDKLITRDELLDELWGHRYVSESAVATQIKTLRKALGDDGRNQRIIKTVHGRGYRFVTPVEQNAARVQTDLPTTTHRTSNLGYERTKLIGRDDELQRCIEAFADYRLVTLLGIGGTGKTRLAKAIGRSVQSDYPDGVWFVDLVPVRDGAGIDTAMASVMGISVQDGEARSQIADAVRDRRVLFILDNCEHIEDEVAAALDYLLENTAAPCFLATSRDPIDLADELRFFIDPLPVTSHQGTAPAVELFMLTAERHGMPEAFLDPVKVEQICTCLDGLPLAIELAAAQLKQLTLDELTERLDRRFELLTGRQREGDHRQDSLIRVVENTWQLLDAEEQQLLGQLAVFPGQFTVQDIEEVFAGQLPNGISFALSRLVELCLLSRTSRSGGWWRLLETVRLFGLEKLTAQAREQNTQRHAEWVLERLGEYPEDQMHSFAQARWCDAHYADLTAAELYFEAAGRAREAMDVCCGAGLMIQLDDGARANAKLKRVEHYLQKDNDAYARRNLHGTAALCAQAIRNPLRLASEANAYLEVSREMDETRRIPGALILASLTNNFFNPELAREQLAEAMEIAQQLHHPPTLDVVLIYKIWSEAVTGQLESAVTLATPLANRLLDPDREMDNPTYNATCAAAACLIFNQPETALHWTRQLLQRPEAHSLWGATVLYASVFAATNDRKTAVELMQDVATRLQRAGRSPWPDLLVPAIILAFRAGETELAAAWYGAIRAAKQPQQMFHSITVYRQLRDMLTPPTEVMSLEAAGSAALDWCKLSS